MTSLEKPEIRLDRDQLRQIQETKLGRVLESARSIPFWKPFLAAVHSSTPWETLSRLPFVTKDQLVADQKARPPFGGLFASHQGPPSRYHQTSGTSGRSLRWLDDPASWEWMLSCWRIGFELAGVDRSDRLFFPFSFGPFLGFWTAFEAASRAGILSIPGGGLSSEARLRMAIDLEATILLGTPSYLLHLGERAREMQLRLPKVRMLIVAGEPGGSIPGTRRRLEEAWSARVIDHCGMTETGPTSMECEAHPHGLHIFESEFLAEIIDPATGQAADRGELVLTNLGRTYGPLLRYRTGDLVEKDLEPCPCGSLFLRLKGGILGRRDDMVFIRGNNFHPSALLPVLFDLPELAEYRATIHSGEALSSLRLEVEPVIGALAEPLVDKVEKLIREKFLFRAEVEAVPAGFLPRADLKARRHILIRD